MIETKFKEVAELISKCSTAEEAASLLLQQVCTILNWDGAEIWLAAFELDDEGVYKELQLTTNLFRFSKFHITKQDELAELQPASVQFADAWFKCNTGDIYTKNWYLVTDLSAKLIQHYRSATVFPLVNKQQIIGFACFYHSNIVQKPVAKTDEVAALLNNLSTHLLNEYIESQLKYSKNYDKVTSLPLKPALLKYVNSKISREPQGEFLMLKLRVNKIQELNTLLGHTVVSTILREIAQILVNLKLAAITYLAKDTGSDYVLVIDGKKSNYEISDLSSIIFESIAKYNKQTKFDAVVDVSIAATKYPYNGIEASGLIDKLNIAVQDASSYNSRAIVFASGALQEQHETALHLKSSLIKAIDNQEFVLHYQPKVNMFSGETVGAEALIRWQQGDKLQSPAYFIEFAEQNGLIVQIGELVIAEVCKQISNSALQVPISINLSVYQLSNEANLVNFIDELVNRYAIPSNMLEFEVTESIFMLVPEYFANLDALAKSGYKISYDDFGKKYSTFGLLTKLIPYRIKIEKDYIDQIPENKTHVAIIKAILILCEELGIKATAEGAEDAAQVAFLKQHGCLELQSYYISKPLPLDKFMKIAGNNYKSRFEFD